MALDVTVVELLTKRRNRIAAIEVAAKTLDREYQLGGGLRYLWYTIMLLGLSRGWLGSALKAAGTPYPYPNGNDPTTTAIDKPAYEPDGVITLPADPILAVKTVRTAIEQLAKEYLEDDAMGPLSVGGAWGWNCQRRSLDHLVEARLLLGEILGAMAQPERVS